MVEATVVSAAVIERDGRFLLTRRLEGTHLAGLWEFPGGKCEPGEGLEDALRREIAEELGVDAEIGAQIMQIEHVYPEGAVRLHFFECRLAGAPHPHLGQELRWVTHDELQCLEFPEADRALIDLLTH